MRELTIPLTLGMRQCADFSVVCSPVIFKNTLHLTRDLSLLLTGLNGLEYWLATFIPIPLIDRLGRRPILLFSTIGQTISMAVLAGSIAYLESKAAGYVASVFLL